MTYATKHLCRRRLAAYVAGDCGPNGGKRKV